MRTAFDKNRAIILKTQEICGICGKPVDKSIREPYDPMAPTVDHIIPINKGGHPSDLANLQLAHRWCNRQKSDKLVGIRQKFAQAERVNNQDLPLHVNWLKYKAN